MKKSHMLAADSVQGKGSTLPRGKMKTMPRLKGFNYRRPFFYMVTLKRRPELSAFSQIAEKSEPPKDAKGRPMYLIANGITRAFARVISEFAGKWRGIALKAVKGHRATKRGSAEWDAMVEDCARIGPGGAGVGTFMSPLEKECGNAIAISGGRWVVLSPEGFPPRWHPPREKCGSALMGECSFSRSTRRWRARLR